MHTPDKLTSETFLEEVERRLGVMQADQLRDVLRDIAQRTVPAMRKAFLDRLLPQDESRKPAVAAPAADDLLRDITQTEARLRAAMKNPPEPQDNPAFADGSGEPYAEFAEELNALFGRSRLAFDSGRMNLARHAYAALLGILNVKDEYGRSVTRPMEVNLAEARARHWRALCDTAPAHTRAGLLIGAMRSSQEHFPDLPAPAFQDVIQIIPAPYPGLESLLDDAIALLGEDTSADADRLLREATRLRRGRIGMEEFARAEGARRPHAWLDWLAMEASENRPGELFAASKEALAALPGGLSLRAVAADHMFVSATALGDAKAGLEARWEAFKVQPDKVRLLDLWESAGDGESRREWMSRAAEQCERSVALSEQTRSGNTDPLLKNLLLEPGDVIHAPATRFTHAAARLLAGDWRGAHQASLGDSVLGWSSGHGAQPLVVPTLLLRCSGGSPSAPPPNLREVWESALGQDYTGKDIHSRVSGRLRAALEVALTQMEIPNEAEGEVLEECVNLALRRVDEILSRQLSAAYDRAASLAMAVIEALRVRGAATDANRILDNLVAANSLKSEFMRELAACQQLTTGWEEKGA